MMEILHYEASQPFADCNPLSEDAQSVVRQIQICLVDIIDNQLPENNQFDDVFYFDIFSRLCHILKLYSDPKNRSFIIKYIYRGLLQLISQTNKAMGEVLMIIWEMIGKFKSDIENISAILCITLKVHPSMLQGFTSQPKFFNYILNCFLAASAHIRRRGAFLLEQSLALIVSVHNLPLNGWRMKRHWIYDYLDVYHQIEGSSALHLVRQVEPYLKHIFHLASAVDTSTSSSLPSRNEFLLTPSFLWAISLFNCLLAAQIPSIRRYAVQLLLGGDLPFEGNSPIFIDWITDEMLPMIDSTLFFPANYSEINLVNSSIYPGVLFPKFYFAYSQAHPNLADYFQLKVLKRIFHLKSLCAMKYLVQVPTLHHSRLKDNNFTLDNNDILAFKSLLNGALLTTNHFVRRQVMQVLYYLHSTIFNYDIVIIVIILLLFM